VNGENDSRMITAGVDIGSVATKAVLVCDGAVLARSLVRSGAEPGAAARTALDGALAEAGVDRSAVGRVVATGYGRRTIDFADRVVTEITAGARGAVHLCGLPRPPRLIVDLGGQDTKAILLDADGSLRDFVMNDKCAAGTGRFLEVMADLLEVPLDQLADHAEQAGRRAAINATCTVFAESEVISLIAAGTPRREIIAGLHAAIASRVAQMVRPLRGRPADGDAAVVFIGGGALNRGVVRALEQTLGCAVHVPRHPQHVVAAGAALTGPAPSLAKGPRPV